MSGFRSGGELEVDLATLLADALGRRPPGNSARRRMALLEGAADVDRYFEAATDASWRQRSATAPRA